MKITILLLLAFVPLVSAEEKPQPMDRLETTNGKVYEKVTIRKVDPDGLSIMHESGAAKIPFEKLPPAMQEAYGFDPAKAEDHRQEQAEKDRQNEAAIVTEDPADVASREAKEQALITKRSNEEDAAFRKKVEALARKISVSAFQNSDVGLIGKVTVKKLITQPVRGSMIKTERVWVHDDIIEGITIGTPGAKVQEQIDATGRHLGLQDTHSVSIVWEGKGWRIGSIRYKTGQGLLRTCPLFTGSIDDAVAFYRQHGFTKEAALAVKKVD